MPFTFIFGYAVGGSPGAVHPGGALLAAGPHCARPLQARGHAEVVRHGLGVGPLRKGHAAGEGPALVAPAGLGTRRPGTGCPAPRWRS